MNYTIVLASSSPRRLELIRTLGIEPLIIPSDVDESVDPMLTPSQVVEELASRKACSVASALPSDGENMIVIGSDTIVVQDGEILGKPQDEEDARRMLRRLAGRSHHVYSGIACIDAAAGRELRGHRRTVVHMKALNDRQIERYIATGEPMDKAGSYAIQGIGATLISGIEGDYFNVVGLSVSLLSDLLLEFGIEIL